ncbi:MAG TPA: TIGR03013 family XrtA/PEP-CTERM system glycosyltransferase [Dissulfurispiraceae bacterium]|nr:TIGR03013 family XrtA/PEP-CTERM system glycosyltransferase [Dissulfurispiraceae bacterium]
MRSTVSDSTLLLVAGDVIIALGIFFSVCFMQGNCPEHTDIIRPAIWVIIVVFSSYLFELYVTDTNHNMKRFLMKTLQSLMAALCLLALIGFVIQSLLLGRVLLLGGLLVFGVLQSLWHWSMARLQASPEFARRILVIGTGALAFKMTRLITSHNPTYWLVGHVASSSGPVEVPEHLVIPNGRPLLDVVAQTAANKVVVALGDRRGQVPIRDLLDCKLSGVPVVDAATFYEELNGKLMIEHLTPSALIFSDGFRINDTTRFVKRVVDLACAGGLLFLVAPMLPIVALLIKMDSPGTVLFRQERVGEGGKTFNVLKFRTMRQDAESKTGAVWALENDPRVTRVGRFLRTYRIDELPQLWNVLRGEMSFVGPRPERPQFVQELASKIPFYAERHSVKPGVTGWAQVRYSYGTALVEDTFEKLSYDLYYIKHMSLMFDILVVLETIKTVLFGRGSK